RRTDSANQYSVLLGELTTTGSRRHASGFRRSNRTHFHSVVLVRPANTTIWMMKSHFEMEFTGDDVFVLADGKRIAKRDSGVWVSLETGVAVLDGPNLDYIEVVFKRARVH